MQAEPGREDASQPASGLERLRPRLAGAVAAVLVAGFAAAALLETRAPPRTTPVEPPAAVVPAADKAAVPANGVIEQTSLGVDDGVPTALNETRRMGGDCHHGL